MTTEIVGLYAFCDVTTRDDYAGFEGMIQEPSSVAATLEHFDKALHFSVMEYARLSDGGSILLREPMGWSSRPSMGTADSQWTYLTEEKLVRTALNVVLPDDAEDSNDGHPWQVFTDTLAESGFQITVAELRELPYDVVFAPRLQRKLRSSI